MKKLLVMMVGLATSVFAFGDPVTLPTGTSFEQLNVGEKLDITKDDGGEATGNLFWSSEDTELDATVTAYDDDAYTGDRPAQFANSSQDKYVTIQTGTKTPLLRTVEPCNDGIVARDIGAGLYIDTLVKFTACESAPEPGADDKLIVWVKGPEDDAEDQTTNLVITAAYLDEFNNVIPTNYTATVSGLDDFDGWHRVTVKAIADISAAGDKVPGFVVFVDGQVATCADEKGHGDSAFGNLTGLAGRWNDMDALFPSMLVGDAAFQTLKAVGFEGSGAIDDVSFTDIAPIFAADSADFTLEWDEHVATLAYTLNGGSTVTIDDLTTFSATIAIPAAQENDIAVTATYEQNYVAGTWETTSCELNGTTFTVVAGTYGAIGTVVSAEDLPPIGTIKIGENDAVPFKTLGEAFALANNESIAEGAIIKISLTDNATLAADNYLGSMGDVTLDLCGKTITGVYDETAEHNYAIAAETVLIITDSVGGGKIIPGEGQDGAVYNNYELTIEKGILDGCIFEDTEVETTLLKGGKFIKEDGNTKEQLEGWLDETADPELYVDESDATYFEVKEQSEEPKTGTVIFICDKLGAPVTNEQEVGTTVVLPTPTDPTQIRTFKGWFEEEALENPVTEPVTVVEGETKIYGKAVIEIVENEIATPLDLQKLQAAVAEGNTFAGETLTQTADIDMSALEWTGIGPVATAQTEPEGAFAGTYDGAGYKIDNLTFKMGNQKIALFNTISGATIKNLVVDSNGFTGTPEDGKKTEGGAILVYRTHGTCVFENVTTEGTYSSNYNPAGFVSDSYGNVTFTSCTNKATIASTYTKAAGFIAIRNAGTVSFVGCVNEGAISADAKSGTDNGYASGFVAYWTNAKTGDYIDVNFKNCVNTGAITASSVVDGKTGLTSAFVTLCQSEKSVTDLGGNIAAENLPAVNNIEGTLTGFTYAVPAQESGYVTYVTELALNGSYKVMNKYAAPVFEFKEAGTIAFNTNLFFVADYTGITAPDLDLTSDEDAGIVTFTCTAKPQDPWPQPQDDAEVAGALEEAGFSDTAQAAITTKEGYDAFVTYCKETLELTDPKIVGSDIKANALISYALDCGKLTEEITSDDVTITAYDAATGDIEVAITGVTPGENVKPEILAKVLTAKGGIEVNALDAANVNVSGQGVAEGKIKVTVTPKSTGNTAFFTQIELNK